MICEQVATLANKLVSLSQLTNSVELTFGGNKNLLDLFERHVVCLSQEVDAWLEAPPRPAMDWKMYFPTDDHEPSKSITCFRQSSATTHTAHFGPLPSPNSPFPAIQPPPIAVKVAAPILPTVTDFRHYLETQGAPPLAVAWSLLPQYSGSGEHP